MTIHGADDTLYPAKSQLSQLLSTYFNRAAEWGTVDLESLCEGQPDVLEELRARIKALASMDEFLETISDDILPGFKSIRELGIGGMGKVYLATEESLGRKVAIKTLRLDRSGLHEMRRRLEAEAQVLGNLLTDQVVQLHQVIEYRENLYLVLEYVDGGTLADRIQKAPMANDEAAKTVLELARIMAAVHDQNVLHRDLKPSNVLVDRQGRLKVTDFGLAKVQLDGGDETVTGGIMGSPPYMAPEQASNLDAAVTKQCDIYGLGAILYELLTHRPPFLGNSQYETIKQVLELEPVAPRRLNPAVDRDLETICLKCLEKLPSRRYATSGELADDLERYLSGKPVIARPTSVAERFWKLCKRHPERTAFVSALSILVVGAAIALGVMINRTQSAEHEKVLVERALGAEAKARELAESEKAATKRALDAEKSSRQKQELFSEMNAARARQLKRNPGWTWENQQALKDVAHLAAELESPHQFRELLMAAQLSNDVRMAGTLDQGLNGSTATFSNNGNWIAVGGNHPFGGSIWTNVYRSTDGKEVATLKQAADISSFIPGNLKKFLNKPLEHFEDAEADGVRSLLFDKTSRQLFVGTRHGKVLAYSIQEGKLLGRITSAKSWITAMQFCDGEKFLLAASQAGQIKRWELGNMDDDWEPPTMPEARLKRHDPIRHFWSTTDRDGNPQLYIVSDHSMAVSDTRLEQVEAVEGGVMASHPLRGGAGWVLGDQRHLTVQDKFLNPNDTAVLKELHSGSVLGLSLSPDNRFAISWDDRNEVIIWSLCDLSAIARRVMGGAVRDVAFSPDARRFLVVQGRRLDWWEFPDNAISTTGVDALPLTACNLSNNGDFLLLMHEGSEQAIRRIQAIDQELPGLIHSKREAGRGGKVAISDAGRVAIAHEDHLVLYDKKEELHLDLDDVRHLAFVGEKLIFCARAGEYAETGNDHASLFSWEASATKPRLIWSNSNFLLKNRTSLLDISVNTEWVLAPSHDGNIYLVSTDGETEHQLSSSLDGPRRGILVGENSYAILGDSAGAIDVCKLSFSEDGKVLSQRLESVDERLDAPITALTANEHWLAAGSADGTIGLWLIKEVTETLRLTFIGLFPQFGTEIRSPITL